MLFNSIQFAIFFIIVYILYLFLSHKGQNRMLLAASCIFYGAWDWRFLPLLFISITTDFFCSRKIDASCDERIRKYCLILSIAVNLSILGFFKYFNFFTSGFTVFLSHFGLNPHPLILKIALPIGISFYTFKTMSYTLDIYAKKMRPVRNYLDYALFVAFFPQLVAGPIMRAKDLLPQILTPRLLRMDGFYTGCYFIFWGLFQKVFIADNLSKIVDPVFSALPPYDGAKLLLALYAFTFQIYCDFAGYSNISIGLGRCMGFDIMKNFNLPYFATNPQEFWRRWHISLSGWFHDYLFTPVAFSKRSWGRWGVVFALAVTFLLCGLWHGAAMTFVIWGAYQAMLLIIYQFLKPLLSFIPSPKSTIGRRTWLIIRIVLFFQLICLGWLIFRAQSIHQLIEMLHALVFNFNGMGKNFMLIFNIFGLTCILLIVHIFQSIRNDKLFIFKQHWIIRAVFYYIIFYLILIFGVANGREFIYFRF